MRVQSALSREYDAVHGALPRRDRQLGRLAKHLINL